MLLSQADTSTVDITTIVSTKPFHVASSHWHGQPLRWLISSVSGEAPEKFKIQKY
jgi:hypothetical protein